MKSLEKSEDSLSKKIDWCKKEIEALLDIQRNLEAEKNKLQINYKQLERDKAIIDEANRQHLQSVQQSLNRVLTDC